MRALLKENGKTIDVELSTALYVDNCGNYYYKSEIEIYPDSIPSDFNRLLEGRPFRGDILVKCVDGDHSIINEDIKTELEDGYCYLSNVAFYVYRKEKEFKMGSNENETITPQDLFQLLSNDIKKIFVNGEKEVLLLYNNKDIQVSSINFSVLKFDCSLFSGQSFERIK